MQLEVNKLKGVEQIEVCVFSKCIRTDLHTLLASIFISFSYKCITGKLISTVETTSNKVVNSVVEIVDKCH
jgi:hypothetical protein